MQCNEYEWHAMKDASLQDNSGDAMHLCHELKALGISSSELLFNIWQLPRLIKLNSKIKSKRKLTILNMRATLLSEQGTH